VAGTPLPLAVKQGKQYRRRGLYCQENEFQQGGTKPSYLFRELLNQDAKRSKLANGLR